ncbi:MAG TPA: FHA domain-containing protein [Vicinamibacterales bacterium]
MRLTRQQLPRAIARAVLANMRESIVPMLYSTIAPSAYVVYLHPDDYALIEDVVPLITTEINRALDEAIAAMNDRPSWRRIVHLVRKPMPHIDVSARPTIDVVPDPNDRLRRGQIAVHSDARLPATDYAGPPTLRVTAAAPALATIASVRPPAILTIEDLEGRREHALVDNPTLVGRGGDGCDVHVRLRTDGQVSKQHCRLKRDESSGAYFITDLSRNGTSVDGQRLPHGVDVALPDRARIGLADALQLEFKRVMDA